MKCWEIYYLYDKKYNNNPHYKKYSENGILTYCFPKVWTNLECYQQSEKHINNHENLHRSTTILQLYFWNTILKKLPRYKKELQFDPVLYGVGGGVLPHTVLIRWKSARIDVYIGVNFDGSHSESTWFQNRPNTAGNDPFTDAWDDPTSDQDVLHWQTSGWVPAPRYNLKGNKINGQGRETWS